MSTTTRRYVRTVRQKLTIIMTIINTEREFRGHMLLAYIHSIAHSASDSEQNDCDFVKFIFSVTYFLS